MKERKEKQREKKKQYNTDLSPNISTNNFNVKPLKISIIWQRRRVNKK